MITEFDVRRRLRASILDDLARSIGVPQGQVSIPEVPEALPPTGGVPWDESGALKVSQSSYDYTRSYWDQIGATVVGRHVFDLTDGWGGKPPSGIDHVVVVTHRPEPEGWDPEAPFRFVDGVEAAVATAQELAFRWTFAGDGTFDKATSSGDYVDVRQWQPRRPRRFRGTVESAEIDHRRTVVSASAGGTIAGWRPHRSYVVVEVGAWSRWLTNRTGRLLSSSQTSTSGWPSTPQE